MKLSPQQFWFAEAILTKRLAENKVISSCIALIGSHFHVRF